MSGNTSNDSSSKRANEAAFIKLIKQYPDVFSKSQTPEARDKKISCLKEIQQKYVRMFNKEISKVQLLKKINNMKSRLRKKLSREGKKIRLKEWEALFMEIVEPDIPVVGLKQNGEENDVACLAISSNEYGERDSPPRVIEFEEECCAILVEPDIVENGSKSQAFIQPEVHSHRLNSPQQQQIPVFRRRLKEETEETKHLSTQELKRLVLLKKLRVLNLKEKKLLQELGDDGEELPDSHDHNYVEKS